MLFYKAENYHFYPFRILLGIRDSPEALFLAVPGTSELRHLDKDSRYDTDSGKEAEPVDDSADNEGFQSPRPFFFDSDYYVSITHSKGAFFYEIELDASYKYLQTLAVIVIAGVLFLVLFSSCSGSGG